MKKVGIITICDYQNYGNRLQNYALQEVLKSLSLDVDTIKNDDGKRLAKENKEKKISERLKRKSNN